MDEAFRKYLEISKILNDDFFKLYDERSDSDHWRRNHIRVLAVLVEGYSHCFREIARVGLETGTVHYSAKELKLIQDEGKFDVITRIKLTLKIIYTLLNADHPDFGGQDWEKAKKALRKRGSLMHPKSVSDLEVGDEEYTEIDEGFGWLVAQHVNVIAKFYSTID